MNKLRFIANGKREGNEKQNLDVNLELEFSPGQDVFLISNNKLQKKKITQININTRISSNEINHDVEYCLDKNNRKKFKPKELFLRLEDIPIQNEKE